MVQSLFSCQDEEFPRAHLLLQTQWHGIASLVDAGTATQHSLIVKLSGNAPGDFSGYISPGFHWRQEMHNATRLEAFSLA
jgi:hypothetical protein